jgi:hypothetical protein
MVETLEQPRAAALEAVSRKVKRYTGEVVYLYAYDVAYDMRREPINSLLGQKLIPFEIDASEVPGIIHSSSRRWYGCLRSSVWARMGQFPSNAW